MSFPIFLDSRELGILEGHIHMALEHKDKRTRAMKFRMVERVLRDLGVLPKGFRVSGLAKGINHLGQQGVWLVPWQEFVSVQAEPALPPVACPNCNVGWGMNHKHGCSEHVCTSTCKFYEGGSDGQGSNDVPGS